MPPGRVIDRDAAGQEIEPHVASNPSGPRHAAGACEHPVTGAAAGVEHLTVFDHRQAFVQLTKIAGATDDERRYPLTPRLSKSEVDVPVDQILIETLDHVDRRRAFNIARHGRAHFRMTEHQTRLEPDAT